MQGSKENIVNILLLAGASKKNISWIMKLRDELLEIQKYSVSVFNYTHWKDGGEIDISEEAKKLSEYLSTNDVSVVIAKSAGSLVTATANMYTGTSLKKAIFIGFPLDMQGRGVLITKHFSKNFKHQRYIYKQPAIPWDRMIEYI